MTGKPSIMCSELKTFENVFWINGYDHLGSHPCLTFCMTYLLFVHICNAFFCTEMYLKHLHQPHFTMSVSVIAVKNTLKIVSVISQSRKRASMDNATTFVHFVKERIVKYLLLSFSSRGE